MAPELKLVLFFVAFLGVSAGLMALMDDAHPHVEAAGMMLAKPVEESGA